MRKLILVLLPFVAACTPHHVQLWKRWHREDPAAAEAFIDDGCGGWCDSWTDITVDDSEWGNDYGGVYEPWISLAECESGGNWHIDTGNGYYGGLQFAWGSWEAVGGSGNPAHASPGEQVMRGEMLQDMQGWNAWPTCARIIGLI